MTSLMYDTYIDYSFEVILIDCDYNKVICLVGEKIMPYMHQNNAWFDYNVSVLFII